MLDYVKFLFIQTIYWDWNAGDFHMTNFSVVTALLGAPIMNGVWPKTKNRLIRRNSRLALTCFDFKVHISAGNTWQKWKSLGHCGRVGLLQASVRNFQGKHLLGSSVSVKFRVIRRIELEKSTCERLLLQKLGVFEGLFLVKLPFYVSYKALILILLSNE